MSAFAAEHGLVLAQRAVGAKRGELSVLPERLESLQLEGGLVRFDALACRREIAERVVARGGDDLITLKTNQGQAYGEVRDWCAAHAFAADAPLRPAPTHSTAATAGSYAGASSPAPRPRRSGASPS